MTREALAHRLSPFIEQGLVAGAPTRWQIVQGTAQMIPHVVIPDGTDRERHKGPLGHAVVRTPLIVAYTLGSHFRVGSGLGSSEAALQKHLLAVHHVAQPVYDLQLVQTFPDGLENLRRRFLDVRDGPTRVRRWEHAFLGAIIASWDEYCDRMMTYIDRAARFDYDESPSGYPEKFYSLTSFLNHCIAAYPASFREERKIDAMARLARLFASRWLDAPS